MPKLKKFQQFADGLYPSEVAYVRQNNAYEDEEIFSILALLQSRADHPQEQVVFDAKIDPRKYSKLIKSFDKKLNAVDVDAYFEWISRVNHLITIDAIPPREQGRIIREMEIFEPGWFHMKSFYILLKNYEGYLLRRLRKSDYGTVSSFLKKQKGVFEKNDAISEEVVRITENIAFNGSDSIKEGELNWLLEIFRDEDVSRKNRYEALLAFMMHHINQKDVEPLLRPMQELEEAIFEGHFYSRRILANFYANKLIVAHTLNDFQTAIFCGYQSVKYHTQDHLYYLNNFVSSLMQLERYEEALQKMRDSFQEFKSSRDLNRRTVFVSHYCRCLNMNHRYAKSAGMITTFLEDVGNRIFESRWHYLFRTYFYALLALDDSEKMIKIEKKFDLVYLEKEGGFLPYIQAMIFTARFREIQLSHRDFLDRIEGLKIEELKSQSEFEQLLSAVKSNSFPLKK